jgi:tripartite-type tricarboxylate transporter receptor subunit TctC
LRLDGTLRSWAIGTLSLVRFAKWPKLYPSRSREQDQDAFLRRLPGIEQVIELHRTAKARVLAVTSPQRAAAAPELATAAEAGFPGLNAAMSLGLLAPARTPKPIIEQIAEASRRALAEPAYRQLLIEGAYEPVLDSDPEKFRASLAADVELWAPIVRSLGLKID